MSSILLEKYIMNSDARELAMKNILAFHQSGSLYGSDKVFLSVIAALYEEFNIIVVLDSSGPLVKKLRPYSKQISVHNLGTVRKSKGKIKFLYEFILSLPFIISLTQKHKPDYFLTSTAIVFSAPLVAKLFGIKNIWMVNEHAEGLVQRKVLSSMINWLSFRVVVPSQSVRKWIGDQAKVVSSVELLDDTRNSKEVNRIRRRIVGKKKIFVLGCVGMFHPKKGQDYFISIGNEILKKYRDVRFVLIGGRINGYEKFREDVENMIDKDKKRYFVFEDFKENILDWMQVLDLIIIPSQYEDPFPLVAQEAMCLGKPIVATAVGGLVEIVKESRNGIFIPRDNPEVSAARISRLMRDEKKMKTFGRNARKIFQREFIFDRFSRDVLECFV